VTAQAGADEATVRLIQAIFAESPRGCGCDFTETALGSGLPAVCNDIANDPRCLPWREAALQRGYRGLCSLPLRVRGEVIGCFNLYADRPDFFIPAEVELLAGLAEDISFGLEMCEREQHRAGTEAARRTAHNRFRALVQDVDAIVWEADPQTLGFTFVSNRAEQLLGFPVSQWLAEPEFRFRQIHPEDREAARRFYSVGGLADGHRHFEHRMLTSEGRVIWLHDHVSAEFADGRLGSLRGLLVDVTAHREAELQLRQLSSVVEQSTEAVLVTDRNGIIQYANRMFEQVSGYPLEELRGQTPRVVSSGKMPRRFFERLWTTVLAGKNFCAEFVNRRRNGELYHAEQTIAPLRNEEGKVTHFVSVGRDITEQKRAERAMRDEQALNQTLLENLAGLFFVISPDGRILRWNLGLETALGVGGEVIRRSHPLDFVLPADRAAAEQALTRAFAEGTAQAELQVRDAADKAAPYYFVARTTELNEQTVLVGLGFDLRERRQAEAEIRRLAAFPELNPEPVVEFAADGRLTYRNRASDALAREVGVGEFTALLPPDTPVLIGECLASNQPRLRLETVCGEHTLSWSFFPIGEQRRVHAYVSDITERVRREALARRSQRLESIGTLAGGIAHDLNNTLTPITMGIQMFRQEHPGESLLADTIEQCALRAANMVRQLVTFARGTTGKRVPVEIRQLVRELELILGSTFPKNIRLNVAVTAELPGVVGDPTQLHQLLLNLCVNARDAMPQGGRLTIAAEAAELDAGGAAQILEARPGQFIRLKVADSGTGIAPAHLERIFDPFFTTKAADRGTGLGLANALGIVRGHNGFINVMSTLGHGSTFEVFLPVAATVPLALPATEPGELPHGQGQTILFVDDERPVARVAGRLLTRLGYHPVMAHSGGEGLEKLRESGGTVAAVITDLHMPGMDGLDFTREARHLFPQVPIIVASGRLEESVATAFEQLGVTLRLDKPFTSPQLANLLAEALQSPKPPA
jgi:PAS domain S-box-containing protein